MRSLRYADRYAGVIMGGLIYLFFSFGVPLYLLFCVCGGSGCVCLWQETTREIRKGERRDAEGEEKQKQDWKKGVTVGKEENGKSVEHFLNLTFFAQQASNVL